MRRKGRSVSGLFCEDYEMKLFIIQYDASCRMSDYIEGLDTKYELIDDVSIHITSNERMLKASILINNVSDPEKSLELAIKLFSNFIDKICITYSMTIEAIDIHEASRVLATPIEEGKGAMGVLLWQGMRITGEAHAYMNHKVKKDITQYDFEELPYEIKLFGVAMRQSDPVLRYMILYNLLLTCNDDKQKKVDCALRKIEPDILMTDKPAPLKGKETRYTRLRNEIAHKREGVDINTTVKEISEVVTTFASLVKRIITDE